MAPDERREYALVIHTVPDRRFTDPARAAYLDPERIYDVTETLYLPAPDWDKGASYVCAHRNVLTGRSRVHWRRALADASAFEPVSESVEHLQRWVEHRTGRYSHRGYVLLGLPFLIELNAVEAATLRTTGMPRSVTIRLVKARRETGVPILPWEVGGTPADSAPIGEWVSHEAVSSVLTTAATDLHSVTHREYHTRWSPNMVGVSAIPSAGRARNPRLSGAAAAGKPVTERPTPSEPTTTTPPGSSVPVGVTLLRPNGAEYITRPFGTTGISDVQWLRECHARAMPVLLTGAPGTGKTAMLEAAFGSDMITMLGTEDTERSDFEGSYVQMADGTFVWIDGPLVTAMEHGRVLFVDEVGLISPKVLSLLYAAMDGRQELRVSANPERGVVRAKPGFLVMAATNPNAPGVRLSEALLSRFLVQSEVTTDWQLVKRLGVKSAVVTALSNLDTKRRSGEVSSSPQMREALAYHALSTVFGAEMAMSNLLAVVAECDRDVVADVLSRALGQPVLPLTI